jgi:phage shock protein B|tara:strand:+ start:7114 stop:7437 length:324 start_codon:yes stop_codon:yes gene_type:complete
MEEIFLPIIICSILFIGLPWLIFHYITKWKTAGGGITTDDEALLEELYALTKRLDDRMDTVERLVAHDHADFKPARLIADNKADNEELDELEALLARKRAEQRETRA